MEGLANSTEAGKGMGKCLIHDVEATGLGNGLGVKRVEAISSCGLSPGAHNEDKADLEFQRCGSDDPDGPAGPYTYDAQGVFVFKSKFVYESGNTTNIRSIRSLPNHQNLQPSP